MLIHHHIPRNKLMGTENCGHDEWAARLSSLLRRLVDYLLGSKQDS
jgi:hypothetical protein